MEFSVALKLRELMIPISVITAVLHVLAATEKAIARELQGFALPDGLTRAGAPELRVIITDDQRLYFVLHRKDKAPKLLGGVQLNAGTNMRPRQSRKAERRVEIPRPTFGPTDSQERGRIEVSVTGLAKDLSRALNRS